MKILNLYAGIGGNRKLWGNGHEITAVEYNEEIAGIYKDFFPNDNVIVGDAHQYLLDHYKEFDFIWSSPPCQSHSDMRRLFVVNGRHKLIYPNMNLYQEIIILNNFVQGLFIVENVKPYYEPLIKPSFELHRHYFWSNFQVQYKDFNDDRKHRQIKSENVVYGFDLNKKDIKNKRQILRNLVNPELGLYILEQAINKTNKLF